MLVHIPVPVPERQLGGAAPALARAPELASLTATHSGAICVLARNLLRAVPRSSADLAVPPPMAHLLHRLLLREATATATAVAAVSTTTNTSFSSSSSPPPPAPPLPPPPPAPPPSPPAPPAPRTSCQRPRRRPPSSSMLPIAPTAYVVVILHATSNVIGRAVQRIAIDQVEQAARLRPVMAMLLPCRPKTSSPQTPTTWPSWTLTTGGAERARARGQRHPVEPLGRRCRYPTTRSTDCRRRCQRYCRLTPPHHPSA